MIGVGVLSTELKTIPVNLGFTDSNLFSISIFIFSFLILAIYLYALDYARYGLPRVEGWKIFKFLQYAANFFYLASVILPLLILLLWLSVFLLDKLPVDYIKQYLKLISIIWSFSISSSSVVFLIIRLIKKEKLIKEKNSEQASIVLLETDRLMKKKEWKWAVIEAFRLIELMFKSKAEEIGIDTSRFSFVNQLRIFIKKGFVTKEQSIRLDQARELRNKAIHSEDNITEEQAAYVIDVIEDVGKSLTYATFTSGFFEIKVGDALSKIFPRHHIIHKFNIGEDINIDFIAEGPNKHKYFIEVKMIKSSISIARDIKQMVSMFKRDIDRGIIIVPSTIKIESIYSNIKILYFDIENDKFINQDEIMSWVYEKGNN